jgi:hypothetical protein
VLFGLGCKGEEGERGEWKGGEGVGDERSESDRWRMRVGAWGMIVGS